MTLRNRLSDRLLLVALLAAAVPLAWSKGLDDFTLTRAVPADAFLAIHTRGHEGQAFLNEQFERVCKAISEARFDRDLKKIFKAILQSGDADLTDFDAQWQKFADLLNGVDWAALGDQEYAMAMRMEFPMCEFVSLMRPKADKVKSNFDGLAALLKAFSELAPGDLALTTDEKGDLKVHKLTFAKAPFPIGVTLGLSKDVIIVGVGSKLVEQSLAMLGGEKGTTLASTPRFQDAFKKLPPPTDSAVFLDIAKMTTQFRNFVNAAIQMAEQQQGGESTEKPAGGDAAPDPAAAYKKLPGKVLDMVDICDYVAEVAATDGMKTTSTSVVALKDDAKGKPLYAVCSVPPVKDPLKYVPKSAGDVSVSSGINLLVLYQEIIKFVSNEIPDAKENIEEFKTQMPVDIEKDILGWIQGNVVTFSTPGATAFAPGEFAWLVRVSDEKKANEMLTLLYENVEPMLAGQNGALQDAQIEGAEGFKSVLHPMIGMMGMKSPTIGVKDGWLFFGSSPDVITKSLETAAGKADSFAKNERFLKEGIPPKGDVYGLSFTDMTNLSDQLGQMLQMVPMMQMAMGAEAAKNPVLQAAFGMVSKFGKVARELNFFQSQASLTTSDGKLVTTQTVVNYRKPPPKPTTSAEATADAKKNE